VDDSLERERRKAFTYGWRRPRGGCVDKLKGRSPSREGAKRPTVGIESLAE